MDWPERPPTPSKRPHAKPEDNARAGWRNLKDFGFASMGVVFKAFEKRDRIAAPWDWDQSMPLSH
jgi:hypothetical protein